MKTYPDIDKDYSNWKNASDNKICNPINPSDCLCGIDSTCISNFNDCLDMCEETSTECQGYCYGNNILGCSECGLQGGNIIPAADNSYCNGTLDCQDYYDLYGVCNHSGGAGFGHYYSYCKTKDNSWCEFNDRNVTKMSADNLVTNAAYCLFYRKVLVC